MTWMIVILAGPGAGLLLYAFGLLQLPTRAARGHHQGDRRLNPDGILVTDRESRIARHRGRSRFRRPGPSDLRLIERRPPARRTSRNPLPAVAGGEIGRARERAVFHRRRAAGEVALVSHSRSSARGRREGLMVWTVSDETRDHDRHETFSRIFSTRSTISTTRRQAFSQPSPTARPHKNATLAGWRLCLAGFSAGRTRSTMSSPETAARCSPSYPPPGEVTTQQFDVDLLRQAGSAGPTTRSPSPATGPGPSCLQ